MGLDLYLVAEVEAVSKVGTHTIRDRFPIWRVPTEKAESIVSYDNVKQAYIDWVIEDDYIEKVEIYDDDDEWCAYPIGYKEVNHTKEHIKNLERWLFEHEGWDILWYVQ